MKFYMKSVEKSLVIIDLISLQLGFSLDEKSEEKNNFMMFCKDSNISRLEYFLSQKLRFHFNI